MTSQDHYEPERDVHDPEWVLGQLPTKGLIDVEADALRTLCQAAMSTEAMDPVRIYRSFYLMRFRFFRAPIEDQ